MRLPQRVLDNLLLAQEEVEKKITESLSSVRSQRRRIPKIVEEKIAEYVKEHPEVDTTRIEEYRDEVANELYDSYDEPILELGKSRGGIQTLIEFYNIHQ